MLEMKNPKGDLLVSIAMLACVVTFALAGLATDRNWPKMLRVSLAFLAYAGTLIAFLRYRGARLRANQAIPLHWFSSAGAAAGVVSGFVRPQIHLAMLLGGTIAAATLLAGVHWFALRTWRRLLPENPETSN